MTIKVFVVDYGRTFLQLRWVDRDGVTRHQSSKCTRRREAERVAAAKELELNSVEYSEDGSIPWATFRLKYEEENVSGLAHSTSLQISSTFAAIERHVPPRLLRDLNSQALSRFVSLRRTVDDVEEDTIKKDLRHVGAALRWAVGAKYLPYCPTIPKIRRAHKSREMKGRPLTDDEFQALLGAVAAQVGNSVEASWKQLLTGLWLSGLRIGEAMQLRWERGPWISVDVSDPIRPILHVPGGRQKSHEEQRLPLTPDFGEFLATTPIESRSGFVFNPIGQKGRRCNAQSDAVRTICAIGTSSGVLVDESRAKFASAHDLRRTFGSRWATRVMPVVLKELMRHATIETTMKFYVGQSISRTHDAVLEAFVAMKSSTSGSTDPEETT